MSMTQRRVILAGTLSIAALASSAYAHHSHPLFYDGCRPITVEGRLEQVEFKDPHSMLVLTLDDGTAYTVDWAGLRGLGQRGVIGSAKESLVVGARVVVTGNLIRATAEIRRQFPDYPRAVNPNTIDPRSIRRVDESFNWGPTPGAAMSPANCGQK